MNDAPRNTRLSVFPLAGALLFPGMHLPLHIFEPRYRAMISDSMARDRRIGMIQPRPNIGPHMGARGEPPALFDIGCVGKIGEFEAIEDGRYNLVLEGLSLFRIVRELDVTTAFRQVEAELLPASAEVEILSLSRRSSLEMESRRFADSQGYAVDWEAVTRLDDEALVNGIAQIAPFDVAAKQALLEAQDIEDRAELIIQLMQFFGRHDGEDSVTLQ
ncbi:LON peptidase substrate-binding domain-containing protein [Sphingomonas alpina]|uniref:LON peptidase substrate-binding domain-containing protein n=1 Tax=Sphingomonas alpina TaxID=653931 RepID=A0A7H0LHE2_9SPHN|nr:LON peptidase substrate-binding domain-containing protein [Sphingomonas alpina]QNQ09095.1 LON peptidase substrate-binding domain-containing protein [Sphingomonas alpina]